MRQQAAFPLTGLEYVKGQPVSLEDAKANGQAVVFEVWATWCPPCRSSIPHLTELAHKYKNVRFVGVTNESASKVVPFVNSMGDQMDYAVAIDKGNVSSKYMSHYGAQGIPFAAVIDKKGNLVYGGHPMDPGFEDALRRADAEQVQSQSAKRASQEPAPKKAATKHVDLKAETKESLLQKSGKELKDIAADHGVSIAGLLEKEEIVEKLLLSK